MCTATWEVQDDIAEPLEKGYAANVLQCLERDRMAAATEPKSQHLMHKELAKLRRGLPGLTIR